MAELDPPVFHFLPDDEYDDGPSEPEPGRNWGLRGKLIAAAVAGALAVSGIVVQLNRADHSSNRSRAAAQPSPTTQASSANWPTGRDVCGNQIRQPIVDADAPNGHAGIELSIGADSLLFGNLDTGQTNPEIPLIGQTFLFDRAQSGDTTFVDLADCAAGNRIERVDAEGQYHTVVDDPLNNGLLTDGNGGVWAARFTDGGATMSEAKLQVILHRLDRPAEIPLGSLMFPLALRGHLLYAEQQVALGAGSRLIVFDLTRRRVVQDLGPFDSAAAIDRVIVWTPHRCTGDQGCQLNSLDLEGDTPHYVSASLPAGFRVNGAVISPDHIMLAVPAPQPAAGQSSADSPAGVIQINLVAGAVYPVPNVQIPPGGHIGLAYAPDSKRLVLAAGVGAVTAFYLWTPGDQHPRATRLELPGPLPQSAYLRAVNLG